MEELSIYCPHCHKHTALSIATRDNGLYTGADVQLSWFQDSNNIWRILTCNSCHNPVLVLNNGETIFPTPLPSPTDKRIPQEIKSDLEEAKKCLLVGAFRASAVMSRRSIQNACLDKGAKNGNLVNQINELKSLGILTNDLQEWAHVVRWVGNDAAHPGSEIVEKEDAEDILSLCEQLMQILYVAPSIAQANKLKRGK